MIPAAFEYTRAGSAEEAMSLLAEHGDEAKLLAGGHSLLPLMKLRLAQPEMLIDVGRLSELSYIRDAGDHVAIGALTRHHDVEMSDLLRRQVAILPAATSKVGDSQVRHRGTFGGSLAHADPASDLPAVILALEATLVARSAARGEREIAAADFYTGFLESALDADELLCEIRVPKIPDAGWSFQKFNRRAQDWAIVGVAAVRNGTAGVGLVNMGPTPVKAVAVEEAVAGGASAEEAAEQAVVGAMPSADTNASVEFRSHLAKVLVRRALTEAETRTRPNGAHR